MITHELFVHTHTLPLPPPYSPRPAPAPAPPAHNQKQAAAFKTPAPTTLAPVVNSAPSATTAPSAMAGLGGEQAVAAAAAAAAESTAEQLGSVRAENVLLHTWVAKLAARVEALEGGGSAGAGNDLYNRIEQLEARAEKTAGNIVAQEDALVLQTAKIEELADRATEAMKALPPLPLDPATPATKR